MRRYSDYYYHSPRVFKKFRVTEDNIPTIIGNTDLAVRMAVSTMDIDESREKLKIESIISSFSAFFGTIHLSKMHLCLREFEKCESVP